MYCTECGFKLPDKAKFCPNCGNKIEIIKTIDVDDMVFAFYAENSVK